MYRRITVALLLAGLLVSTAVYSQETTPEVTPETMIAVAPITLVTYTDNNYRIQTLLPEAWTPIGNGMYARSTSPQDVALVALQSVPFGTDQVLTSLMSQIGLTEAPAPVGEYATDALTWTLYQVDVPLGTTSVRVRFALAEQRGISYTVLVQALQDDFAALYDEVFEPMLDGFVPITNVVTDAAYSSEDVTFMTAEADILLAGTLTLPEGDGPFTALVLFTGSGPQDRNEHFYGSAVIEPFALLADGLTNAGYAVLRYDDRGVAQSEGNFATATITDFTNDARAALAYLRERPEIDPARVGVLGHSEGGIYAALLGAEDLAPAFIVSMAGTAVSGSDLLLKQNQAIIETSGGTQENVDTQIAFLKTIFPLIIAGDYEAVRPLVEQNFRTAFAAFTPEQQQAIGDENAYVQQQTDTFVLGYANAWMAQFLALNPSDYWAQTTVPVLAIFGGKDIQVDAGINAEALVTALETAGNNSVTIVTLPEANHLFQNADTGALTEYATLPAEFVSEFVPTIVDWLNNTPLE